MSQNTVQEKPVFFYHEDREFWKAAYLLALRHLDDPVIVANKALADLNATFPPADFVRLLAGDFIMQE